MFQKMIDDLKDSTGSALRLTSLAIAVAACLFITTAFLCAAAFVFTLQKYGLLQACLAGAAVFFVATVLAAIGYAVKKKQMARKPVETAKSAMSAALSDPMMMAVALQVIRAVGVKRLVPLLAIGGIALGLMSQRRHADEDATDD
jgi:small-conductance mechanosensitive channel